MSQGFMDCLEMENDEYEQLLREMISLYKVKED